MIIECFGLPGAGKTTLVSKLIKEEGFVTVPEYVAKWYAVLYFFRRPLFTIKYFYILLLESLRSKTWKLFRFKLSVFINTIGRMGFALQKKTSQSVFIIDEGILQRLLSLYESKIDKSAYADILGSQVCAVVHVTSPNSGRIGTERKKLGEAYAQKWREVMRYNEESIMRAAQELKIPSVLFEHTDTLQLDRNFVMHLKNLIV